MTESPEALADQVLEELRGLYSDRQSVWHEVDRLRKARRELRSIGIEPPPPTETMKRWGIE